MVGVGVILDVPACLVCDLPVRLWEDECTLHWSEDEYGERVEMGWTHDGECEASLLSLFAALGMARIAEWYG